MSSTVIKTGSDLARKIFGAAVFAEVVKKPGLTKRLTGPAPQMGSASKKLERMETNPDYPFVRITDLSRGGGDRVSVDLFNILQGYPTIGDEKLLGKEMKLTTSSMEVLINQFRGSVNSGGQMTRQRTIHDLRRVAKASITGWFHRFLDQSKLVHLAGDRGIATGPDWVVPLRNHADFSKIMINTVKAPTHNRHLYAGGKTSLANLTTADILTLPDLDIIRTALDDSYVQTQPIILPDDPSAEDSPMWLMLLSHRQWHYFINRSDATSIRQFQQNAMQRGASNPLFKGEVGMWNGILVKKMVWPIRFNQGDVVTVAADAATYTETTETVATFNGSPDFTGQYAVDRALILGAQAAAEVWGQHSGSGSYMSWEEELTDYKNTVNIGVSAMGGCAKLRFTALNGEDFDHGVWVMDSYAPDPRTVSVA